jgi:hypothetical protein
LADHGFLWGTPQSGGLRRRPTLAIWAPWKAPVSPAGESLALIVSTCAGTIALARSRLVAVVLAGTIGRSRVYRSWLASSVHARAADGKSSWLCTDGKVATAESGLIDGKHPHALAVTAWPTASQTSDVAPPRVAQSEE